MAKFAFGKLFSAEELQGFWHVQETAMLINGQLCSLKRAVDIYV
jgi:transposase-like protein